MTQCWGRRGGKNCGDSITVITRWGNCYANDDGNDDHDHNDDDDDDDHNDDDDDNDDDDNNDDDDDNDNVSRKRDGA